MLRSFCQKHTVALLWVLLVVSLGGAGSYIHHEQTVLLRALALNQAGRYARIVESFRSLYTSEVVERVRPHGIEVRHDYLKKDGAIPLPATLSIMLGDEIARTGGGAISLYSPYPFPWRAATGGLKDNFARDAWAAFAAAPDSEYVRVEMMEGRMFIRYAKADLMRQSCVACHNTHPDSPRRGWKVGDVRGVLEVRVPLDEPDASMAALQRQSTTTLACLALVGLAFLAVVVARLKRDTKQAIILADERAASNARLLQAVTESERYASSLRQHEARLEATMAASLDPMICIESDGTVLSASDSVEGLTGRNKRDLIGKNVNIIMPEPYRSEHDGYLKRYLETGKSSVLGRPRELDIQHEDGTIIPVEISVSRVEVPGAFHPLFLGILRDLRARRAQEKEREELEAQLHHASKMEAVGRLAGGIAHDFNNILSGIMGFTELVKEQSGSGPEVQSDLSEVLKAATRGRDLVRQILTFSGRSNPEKAFVDLAQSTRETASFVRVLLHGAIRLECHTPENPAVIWADAGQVHEVILNLCTNAIAAMEGASEGLLDLSLERIPEGAEELRHLHQRVPCAYYRLAVRDTGAGIAPENIGHVFEPFFTTKSVGKGTGLGLAVVHSVIKAHDGTITVDSVPGEGTTFYVYFPCANGTVELPAERASNVLERGGQTGGEHILVVDDEVSIVMLSTRLLRSCGYRVTAAGNGREALDIFAANPNAFDLVLTDLTMPFMTGDLLAEEVLRLRPELPIIICSGYGEEVVAAGLGPAGVRAYLRKPVPINELIIAVRRALNERGPASPEASAES